MKKRNGTIYLTWSYKNLLLSPMFIYVLQCITRSLKAALQAHAGHVALHAALAFDMTQASPVDSLIDFFGRTRISEICRVSPAYLCSDIYCALSATKSIQDASTNWHQGNNRVWPGLCITTKDTILRLEGGYNILNMMSLSSPCGHKTHLSYCKLCTNFSWQGLIQLRDNVQKLQHNILNKVNFRSP